MSRPYCRAERLPWRGKQDGIAIIGGRGPIVAHMDANQARALADRLYALAEALEAATEPVTCPRCSKTTSPGKCDHCNAQTSRSFIKMEKGTANVR